jgi:hypothetical protein
MWGVCRNVEWRAIVPRTRIRVKGVRSARRPAAAIRRRGFPTTCRYRTEMCEARDVGQPLEGW